MESSLNNKSGAYQKIEKFDGEKTQKIAELYKEIIHLSGEDVTREGLEKTPLRVAKAMQFLLQGYEMAMGLAETVFDLLGKNAGQWGQLAVAKAVFDYSKVFYAAYGKYQEINMAYEKTMFLPITAHVRDDTGYEDTLVRQCSVKV